MQKRDLETYQKCFRDLEILPKFSEVPTFFEVPFATPNGLRDGMKSSS